MGTRATAVRLTVKKAGWTTKYSSDCPPLRTPSSSRPSWPGRPPWASSGAVKTTHLGLEERDRALAGMRASQLGVSLTEYIAQLIRHDADQAGLSQYSRRCKEGGVPCTLISRPN